MRTAYFKILWDKGVAACPKPSRSNKKKGL